MPTLTTLVSFDSNNAPLGGGLIADAAGNLYGTRFGSTSGPGLPHNNGGVFEIAKTANGYASTPAILVRFDDTDGANPSGSLVADAAGNLFGTTSGGGANGTARSSSLSRPQAAMAAHRAIKKAIPPKTAKKS